LVFLGAGASKVFGVPTMREFVEAIDARVGTAGGPPHLLFSRLITDLKSLYGESSDLEKVLDIVHDRSIGRTSVDIFKELSPDAADRLRYLIERTPAFADSLQNRDRELLGEQEVARGLEAQIISGVNALCDGADLDRAAQVYLDFASSLLGFQISDRRGGVSNQERVTSKSKPVRPLNIVTTNYDLCFESFCSDAQVGWNVGFEPTGPDQEQTFVGAPRDGQTNYPILKLHGSIDWWRTNRNRVVRRPHGQVGQRLLDGSRIERMEIRYPVGSKDLFGDPYLKLYARFAEWLSSCPVWIFIGYSFGDPSVRQLVRESLREHTRMYVVHPRCKELEEGPLRGLQGGSTYWINDRWPSSNLHNTLQQTARL
jgi:hypothetical protein